MIPTTYRGYLIKYDPPPIPDRSHDYSFHRFDDIERENMNVDGVEYEPVQVSEKYQIIVCHRGFVFAGFVSDSDSEVVIRRAVNIRAWGTTDGLGQLAISGVTHKTVLDLCGTVRVHPLSIVCRLDSVELAYEDEDDDDD